MRKFNSPIKLALSPEARAYADRMVPKLKEEARVKAEKAKTRADRVTSSVKAQGNTLASKVEDATRGDITIF